MTVTINGSGFVTGISEPKFSASMNVPLVVVDAADTLVPLPVKTFDVGGYFSTATSRYTPLVAGYYLFILGLYGVSSTNSLQALIAELWRNNAPITDGGTPWGNFEYPDVAQSAGNVHSRLVYLNGSTDYVSLTARTHFPSGTTTIEGAMLQGFFVGV